jgi:hypothetical protein
MYAYMQQNELNDERKIQKNIRRKLKKILINVYNIYRMSLKG